MINQQRLWLSLGLGSLCSVLLFVSACVAPPRTEREAVMAILDLRSIAYEDVQVYDSPENGMPQDHFASVAAVVVEATRTLRNPYMWFDVVPLRDVSA